MTERTEPNNRPSDPGDGSAATPDGGGGGAPVRLVGRSRTRRPGELLRRKGLRLWLVLILAMASVATVGVLTPLSARSSTAGATTPCSPDGSGGCLVTLPCPVGQSANCPTIDVTPNTNVNDGQYVYVTAKNFDPTTSIRVAFCAANTSPTDPTCLNGNWDSQLLTPTAVPVTSDPSNGNLTSLSYPVFLDPSGQGNDKIPAHDLINKTGTVPSFNCDNTTDPCELVVTDEPGQANNAGNGPVITADNSAVVPLVYSAQSAGCPASDPSVDVENSFSLQRFIPAAMQATCFQPDGVIASNLSTDDGSVVKDYAAGGTTISFVDNASDPNQVAALLGKAYAYIPIALSGTTESFLAGESTLGQNFPINTYNLTPNMVAGLISSLYQQPTGSVTPPPKPKFVLSDNLMDALGSATPAVTCAQLVGCPATKTKAKQIAYEVKYDAFDLANAPPSGVIAPAALGSFNSNVASGSSYQATSWLCSAPNTPFDVTVDEVGQSSPTRVKVTDTNVASTTLTSPPIGSSIWPPYAGANWVYPSCTGYTTLPALSATSTNFGAAQSPDGQAKAMRTWCYGGGVLPAPQSAQTPCAAFGLMDTSEAQFYGLSTASLENASGDFVAPTVASLQAAAAGFTRCPDADLSCPAGTYSVNYGDTNPAAYPMANLTYAIVPTSTLSYDEGTAVKHLLTNLLKFSHSIAVPAGYAPLPDAIYQQALTDVTNDLSIAPAPPAPPATTTTTAAGGSTNSTSGGSGSGTGQDTSSGSSDLSSSGGTSDLGSGSTSALPLTAGGGTGGTSGGGRSTPVAAPPASIPTGFLLVGLSATTRFLLPAIVILALGSLVGGLLLLLGPGATTRRRRHDAGGVP